MRKFKRISFGFVALLLSLSAITTSGFNSARINAETVNNNAQVSTQKILQEDWKNYTKNKDGSYDALEGWSFTLSGNTKIYSANIRMYEKASKIVLKSPSDVFMSSLVVNCGNKVNNLTISTDKSESLNFDVSTSDKDYVFNFTKPFSTATFTLSQSAQVRVNKITINLFDKLTSITAKVKDSTKIFYEGDTPSINDFELTKVYSLTGNKICTTNENFTIISPNTYVSGKNTVTIQYNDGKDNLTCTVDVNAQSKKTITNIEITGWENKVFYLPCDWNFDGIKAVATYDDSTSEDISRYLGTLINCKFTDSTGNVLQNPNPKNLAVKAIFTGKVFNFDLNKTLDLAYTVEKDKPLTVEVVNANFSYDLNDKISLNEGTTILVKLLSGKSVSITDLTKVNVYLDDTLIDITSYVLSAQDNGKKISFGYLLNDVEKKSLNYDLKINISERFTTDVFEHETQSNSSTWLNVTGTYVTMKAVKGEGQYGPYVNKDNYACLYVGNVVTFEAKKGFCFLSATVNYHGSKGTGFNNINWKEQTLVEITLTERADFYYIDFKMGAVKTDKDFANEWVATYLHMNDYDPELHVGVDGAGLCAGPDGYYNLAKNAFLKLSKSTRYLICTDENFANAYKRFSDWAAANKEKISLTSDDAIITKKSNDILIQDENESTLLIASCLVVCSLLGLGFVLVIRRRKQEE